MNNITQKKRGADYIQISEELCNGCVLCMKACPTKAIRIKEGRLASIEGVCVGCGECIRVCPKGAIKAISTESYDLKEDKYFTVSASTVLYAQFGEDVMPNDVLLALKKMGFRHVHDQSYTNEIFNVAIELYIKENRKKFDSPYPLISPVCPAVVRIIAHRFPSLLDFIPPLATPREIVAREAKKRLSAKHGIRPEDIKVSHITPCLAHVMSISEPVRHSRSYVDRAIGTCDIYDTLKKNINELDDDIVLHHSGGVGLGWGMSGGEIASLNMSCLAVSGIQETMRYLEKIEIGLLHDIDYVEFRTCPEGCLGGPFNVADKYRAKRYLQKLVRMFGVEKRVKYDYVRKLYEEGWFFTDKKDILSEVNSAHLSIPEGIEKQSRVEEVLQLLPGKECGVCGYPDCRTFAEDVVDGNASIESCIYLVDVRAKKEFADES